MLGRLLDAAIADASFTDVHDRAMLYYRLLQHDGTYCSPASRSSAAKRCSSLAEPRAPIGARFQSSQSPNNISLRRDAEPCCAPNNNFPPRAYAHSACSRTHHMPLGLGAWPICRGSSVGAAGECRSLSLHAFILHRTPISWQYSLVGTTREIVSPTLARFAASLR